MNRSPLVFSTVLLSSFLFSCSTSTINNANESHSAPHVDGYQLVWQDEFNCQSKLDENDWNYEQGFKRNFEAQYYQSDNVNCNNGILEITAKKEVVANAAYQAKSNNWRKQRKKAFYTSGSINTKGKHSWQYGRFEVRARIKTQDGLWPAIWFLGNEGNWPANGELDLMEYYQGKILANAAWAKAKNEKPKWDSVKTPMSEFNDPNWDEKFHLWRMDWDKDFIHMYLDGKLLNTIDLSKAVNPEGRFPKQPFQQPHYLLLNLAIGGSAGGDPSQTPFPSKYEIDFVRVYQKQP
ncbi:glycoside hydrolase family 16 protein [Thalassotalea sp. PLHSN55]|uniref:glycoside hydrolase family 16 protein n=1 Tax=Thalassotalea sp. PLHSN55 TaxID=3435888 RepID=UPI003F82A3EA